MWWSPLFNFIDLRRYLTYSIKFFNFLSRYSPDRYLVADLVDWFYKIMRKDESWGYVRYDMKYDPLFSMKIAFNQLVSWGYPFGGLHWESIEKVTFTESFFVF